MNTISLPASPTLFGIYEMDAAGTVFYHKSEMGKLPDQNAPSVVGLNFFDEVAAFENIKEFQRRFKNFLADSHVSDNFNFDFQLQEQILNGRVRLMRVRERQNDESSDLVIVDIRQVLI